MSAFNDAIVNFGRFLLGMQSGVKSFITQPYTEVNSKSGVQHETAFYLPSLGVGSTHSIAITTGSQALALKGVSLTFDVELVSSQWFKNPSFSGGAPLPIYNMRAEGGAVPEVAVQGGVTVTSEGTAMSSKLYSIGSAGVGNRHISSQSLSLGVERILEPNSTYLYRVTNEDSVVMRAVGNATWYEGELDFNP